MASWKRLFRHPQDNSSTTTMSSNVSSSASSVSTSNHQHQYSHGNDNANGTVTSSNITLNSQAAGTATQSLSNQQSLLSSSSQTATTTTNSSQPITQPLSEVDQNTEVKQGLKPGLLTVKVYSAKNLEIPLPLRVNKPILYKLASLGHNIDEAQLQAKIDTLDDTLAEAAQTNLSYYLPSTLRINNNTGKSNDITHYNLVYTVVEVENSSERISSMGNSVANAKFNTVTTFDITSPNTAFMTVQIYSRIPGSLLESNRQEDHLLGSFSYKLSDFLANQKMNQPIRLLNHAWVNLKNPYNDQDVEGALNITLDYKPLTSEKMQLTIDDFELLKVIGKGSFGKVMQVRKKDTGKIYALKSLRKAHIVNKMEVTHTLAEKFVLSRVNSPFIVPLKFAFQSAEKLYLVLSFINGGELFHHLQIARRFTLIRAKFYICELLSAIETLHKMNIVYRDLKPENILLDHQGHIALCDFGLCKINMKNDQKTNTFCGTPEYLAPELLLSKGYTRVVDFWTIGVLLYEMITSLPPFYDEDVNKMYQNILNEPLKFPVYVDDVTKDLITKLLNRDPEQRLGYTGVEEIKAHPFFKDIDWEKLNNKGYIPPFKPEVKDSSDITNISQEFTMEKPLDSVVDDFLSESVQKQFGGWTYVGSFGGGSSTNR